MRENLEVRNRQLIPNFSFLVLLVLRLPEHFEIVSDLVIDNDDSSEPVLLRIHGF